jgi:hypothetical protein
VIVVSGWIALIGGMCVPGGGVCAIAIGAFAQPAITVAASRAAAKRFILRTFLSMRRPNRSWGRSGASESESAVQIGRVRGMANTNWRRKMALRQAEKSVVEKARFAFADLS